MKSTIFRCLTLGAAVSLTPVVLFAQTTPSNSTTNPTTNDTTGMATTMQSDSSGSMGANGQMMNDKMFVKKASEGGMAEVSLAQIAMQKSNNAEVKKLAQKMITDHTMLNEKMKPVADSLGVPPPTQLNAMDQAESDKLSSLSGADFDKEYLDYMVKDHHKDLAEFRQEARTASDPQLKVTAANGAKVIGQHTKMVDMVAQKNGVSVPAGGM